MSETPLDLAAAGRVSRRVDLREIRLASLSATCKPDAPVKRQLHPAYEYECIATRVEPGLIEVECSYSFRVTVADSEVATASLIYFLAYRVSGEEPPAQTDVEHFARANGAYHSWPFVRETMFGLTAKMGFPPYTLPVLLFSSKPKATVPAAAIPAASEAGDSTATASES